MLTQCFPVMSSGVSSVVAVKTVRNWWSNSFHQVSKLSWENISRPAALLSESRFAQASSQDSPEKLQPKQAAIGGAVTFITFPDSSLQAAVFTPAPFFGLHRGAEEPSNTLGEIVSLSDKN